MNGTSNIDFRQADVFDFLAAESGSGRTCSTIILDPPAFAKSRSAVDAAARGYKEINLRALRMLEPGGLLVTCSCSHHMDEATLLATIAEAALDAGRTLRIRFLLTEPPNLSEACAVRRSVASAKKQAAA